ncbi:hypothetical protein D3C84_114040 [compost metagenome]
MYAHILYKPHDISLEFYLLLYYSRIVAKQDINFTPFNRKEKKYSLKLALN